MRPVGRLFTTAVAGAALLLGALPATADDGAPSGETPPPGSASAPSARAAAASGVTTKYTDDDGRLVFRVDDGFDLDQYLYRGELTFSFDIDEAYGPVDEYGHPAPGNDLYGKQMLLTLRAWDVDEVSGEVDEVRFNGSKLIPGALSGADSQWATDTFDVWASWLRLPTADNPNGTNTVTIDVDVNNGGWAVQVDWAELRPLVESDAVRPVVLAHGITDNDSGAGRSGMWELDDYLVDTVDKLGGRTSSPQLTQHGSVVTNAGMLRDEIDEMVQDEPTDQVDVVAHSMGGLAARLYAFQHPGRVRNLVMLGTPNHGSELATALCVLRGAPGGDKIAPEFGGCDSADDGLLQLVPSFVEKFNSVVTDLPSVEYRTIAGRSGGLGSLLTGGIGPGIAGEDDGTVSVESVRWLSVADPDHPGLHLSEYPTVDVDHMGLIHSNDAGDQPLSFAMVACLVAYDELSFCPLPVDLDGTETTVDVGAARTSASAGASATVQDGAGPIGTVEPGATVTAPVDAVAGETAGLIVFADEGLDVTLDSAALESTDVFGVDALGAEFEGPATLTVHNPTDDALSFGSTLRLLSERTLALDIPSRVSAGTPLVVDVRMTGALPEEAVTFSVADGSGVVVADGTLPAAGDGTWTTELDVDGPDTYTVHVSTSGDRVRSAMAVVSVLGGAELGSSIVESTTDPDRDGLADSLVVDVPVDVEAAGDYQVSLRILGAGGRVVSSGGAQATLGAGRGSIAVDLDGRDIYESGVDGPWTLSAVLSDPDLDILAAADLGAVDHDVRQSYEHDALAIAGLADEGIDSDGDGLIDLLRITGDASTEVSGSYALNGKLVASDGTEVGRASTTVRLAAGTTGIALEFSGAGIGSTGKDGPFILRDLTLYPATSPSGGIALVDAYRTAGYRSAQFPGGSSGDLPPTASIEVVLVEGMRVELDGSASADDHGIASYVWDLGDGSTATGALVAHDYAAPGDYVVTLTVTDGGGQRAEARTTVTAAVPSCEGHPATIVSDGRAVIQGTNGDDVIVGTSADERIDGGLGNDVICGGGGDDVLVGSNGADRLFGGGGNDRLDGGDGDDHLDGGDGHDTLIGANGRDALAGGAADDVLDGGDGSDTISGGDGADTIRGANGDDDLSGEAGDDVIEGGDGNDVISGGDGADVIDGANGRDTIDGGDGADIITSGEGDDVIDAGAGDDRVYAGGNHDVVHAGRGDDHVEGGEGDDVLWGEDGDDVLLGQGGNDEIDGGAGTDMIDGGNGRNTIRDVP